MSVRRDRAGAGTAGNVLVAPSIREVCVWRAAAGPPGDM